MAMWVLLERGTTAWDELQRDKEPKDGVLGDGGRHGEKQAFTRKKRNRKLLYIYHILVIKVLCSAVFLLFPVFFLSM